MGQAFLGGLVVLAVGLPTLIAPRLVWALFAGLSFRTPAAIEPSAARVFQWRASGAALTVLGAASLIGALWPGEDRAKLHAFSWAVIIGVPVAVVCLIVGAIIRSRFRSRSAAADEDLPPDEPSELSYLVGYIGVAVFFGALLVMASMILSTTSGPTASERREQEQQEQDQAVIDYQKELNTVSLIRYPVVTTLPDDEALALPRTIYANPFPEIITNQSSFAGADMTLADADLALETPTGFRCTVTRLIIEETEASVTIGLVVKNVRMEGSQEAQCILRNDNSKRFYLVDLAAPLGQRPVLLYGSGEQIAVR